MTPQGDSTTEAESNRIGVALFVAVLAVAVAVWQGVIWAWANPLAAAGALACAGVLIVALRWVLVRTGLDRPLRRFLSPLWALVWAGITTRIVLARTTVTDAITDRLTHWASRPVRPVPQPDPAASYEFRPVGYTLEVFDGSSPERFEELCRELLDRDGFTDAVCVGGAGDLGADVLARDTVGRRVVVQCKRYAKPIGSQAMQAFNGTARPEHRAAVPVMVGLNGFTAPAVAFAEKHRLHLIDRERLARWGAGYHLYDVLEVERTTS
ncbi:restriction endonuclease [Kitasatospora sp. NPDC089509]|uniref:restriction endonuclease n=1 Tax=Kitasatospora sp. NPDC089509 TaxID=3364079 RepID=UPI003811220F